MRYFTLFAHLWLLATLALFLPPSIYAAPRLFHENFDTGFQQWRVAHGSLQDWSIEDTQARATVITDSTLSELIPKTSTWNAAWKNIRYSLDYTPLTGTDRNLSFGYQDSLNWYDLHFTDTFYELARVKNGIVVLSQMDTFILKNGQTHHIVIELVDGHIKIVINDQVLLDMVDWTFQQNYGMISLKATTGAAYPTIVQFDNILVEPLFAQGEKELYVDRVQQTDAEWARNTYDHASDWAKNTESTIYRWGCALSSMVMVLHYYDITTFADGLPLTPATLNQWLLSQPDGYLHDGALNWQAVTRLVRELSEQYHTPKLEFSFLPFSFETVANEVLHDRPVIVEVPGHFVVADGLSRQPDSIHIQDPAFQFSTLQEHQQALSLRRFVPSQTDLRAFVASVPDGVSLTLFSEDTSELTHSHPSVLTAYETASVRSPISNQLIFSQPPPGVYRLEVGGNRSTSVPLLLFTYDKQGNMTDFSTLLEAEDTTTFLLDMSATGITSVTKKTSWADIQHTLEQAQTDKTISSAFVAYRLLRVPEMMRSYLSLHPTDQTQTPRAEKMFLSLLTYYQTHINPSVDEVLKKQLTLLHPP